ncbi:DUF2249 domain-containing protein (plasmid) [Haloferax mediterranei ATCC 33500]|uniref:DUF2249 domain-containing protein n=1 Tax=Haloferax mediterranei (strain ATCC 33500 / DSM 1411 / JCM 8866 / NBRC 14739 / NCIMB 2177 / R-4) TaxID=523841 RepID=I3R9M0_HALMT|nr:DUF2249 domain-containing protein [Haloferax mediterranei]AFK20930.1 Uncharacterized conserved protein (DUF2249) [Haloferax mediterranei ATCC 33500]AHZ24202.1 hypothetical protein BM92_18545 [Haloferax mediterranei ATCC 33500]EMA05281.1 hypothetical protein C439_00740 [Haloferax mediterranei ATCC 33500]MDX5989917.1 DUF2249 domain-containing protein [Haloferax mediterranei ATCC 33500]QCQ77109.1 DUF2249 domain-containing protein [Haloferax mediterranei ATCC 33500]
MAHTDSEDAVHTLDVRDLDGEPFGEIMAAVDGLTADESFLLVNSFEPVPLYDVLEQRGFEYETSQVAADEWHITITSR